MENQPEPIRPQLGPQESFLASTADIALYGGQAGGGKTWSVLMEATRHIANPGFRAIFFRKTRPQIRALGGLWDTSVRIFPSLRGSPRENTLEWRFPSGAIIKFDFLNQEEDKYRHDGAQNLLDPLAVFRRKAHARQHTTARRASAWQIGTELSGHAFRLCLVV